MSQDPTERQRRRNMIEAVANGITSTDFADTFCVEHSTARLYIYKIKKGIIRNASPGPRKPRIGRRGIAMQMFEAGRTVDEVIAATGLKRKTAHTYAYEQRCIAAHQAARDPLCD